jgi:hypothetical protein
VFNYVRIPDAIGMLYQEACVKFYDLMRDGKEGEAKPFGDAADAIKAAWPELVAKSLDKEHLPEQQ